MPASAFLSPAQARHVRASMGDMSRQLHELICSIPLVLAQLRLIPNPQFFLQVVHRLDYSATAHTNSVLGQTPYRLDTFGISNPLNNNEILAGALRDSPPAAAGPATSASPSSPPQPPLKGRKPKKEKKEKDPNEPKRPLTIFFLFAHEARPVVKEDLGPDAWKAVYEQNREVYSKKMEEYKASLAAEAAKSPAGANGDVEMAEGTATAAGADAEESADADAEEESEEASPPPRAPSPPAEAKTPKNKRRKTGKENGVVAASSATAPTHAASPIPLPSHPKTSGVESTPVAKPKEKRGKKEEPAPAVEAVKEPAPEEPAKKKRGRKQRLLRRWPPPLSLLLLSRRRRTSVSARAMSPLLKASLDA
ncbi:putative hmg box [Botryosphaeria dothidea]|uniref:Hmg box n=1 Tax=Botryosphaeria dothidea TaxID=55169 RepID=A0A8H4IM46_9PEZI|nr:putative hmg box [Botryosphaeria dothidea]